MSVFKSRLIKLFSIIALIFCICPLDGCSSATEESVSIAPRAELEISDILSNPWVAPDSTPVDVEGWEVSEYFPHVSPVSNANYSLFDKFTAFIGNKLYSVNVCNDTEDPEQIGFITELCSYDLETKESRTEILRLSEREILNKPDSFSAEDFDNGNVTVVGMDTMGGDLVLFAVYFTEVGASLDESHYIQIRMAPEGPVKEIIDYGARNESDEFFLFPQAFCFDEDRIVFFYSVKLTAELVDKKGNVETVIDMKGSMSSLALAGRSAGGKPVFICSKGGGKTEFFTLDTSGKRTLVTADFSFTQACVDEYGNAIILNSADLLLYNVLTGELENLYSFRGLDDHFCENIYRTGDNEIYVCYREGVDAFLYKVDDLEHPDQVELTLMLDFEDGRIESCVADFNRTHPGITIKVEYLGAAFNDTFAWAKLIQKIKDGNGPDLIWTSRARLVALKNAGAICPIDDLITQEVKDNVFASALRFGEIDSNFYAMPFLATLDCWFIDEKDFDKDTWTLTEALDTYDAHLQKVPDSTFMPGKVNDHFLLQLMCLSGVEYSEFVDLDTHKCDFKNEDFYRLLRFCVDDGNKDVSELYGMSREEQMTAFKEGKALVYQCAGGLKTYSYCRKYLGDNCHPIGFPSDKNVRAMVEYTRGMAMSVMSEHKDIAAEFITALTEEDYQVRHNSDGWIRKDVLRAHVKDSIKTITKDGYIYEPGFILYPGVRNHLDGREDGTSYLEDFIELMDAAVPASEEYDIQNIILEEAMVYFSGQKTEQEVADIIEKRVRIYLAERE